MNVPLAILVVLATATAAMARGRDDCAVPMADWQPREAVRAMAAAQGWVVRRIKIDDGCYEIYATDAQGQQIEAKVDPATLAILEVEQEDHDDDDHGRYRGHD